MVVNWSDLGLGLSGFLRYCYPGVLFLLFAVFFDDPWIKMKADAIGDNLSIFVTVVFGAGLYIVHRSIVIPCHHFLLILFQRTFEILRHWGRSRADSRNPVVYLRHKGVIFGCGIISYSILRRSGFFERHDELDIAHAEIGLIVMTSEALLLAAAYNKWVIATSTKWGSYFFVAGVFLFIVSFVPAWVQHTVEYLEIKRKDESAAFIGKKPAALLRKAGVPMKKNSCWDPANTLAKAC